MSRDPHHIPKGRKLPVLQRFRESETKNCIDKGSRFAGLLLANDIDLPLLRQPVVVARPSNAGTTGMNQPMMIETQDFFSSDRYDLNQPLNGLAEPLSANHSGQCTKLTHGKSHHQQHPVRRRNGDEFPTTRPRHLIPGLNLYIAIVILISFCCTLTAADATTILPAQITNPLGDAPEDLRLALAHLAESGTIVVDPRPPPPVPGGNYWQIENVEKEGLLKLIRRSSNSSSTVSQSTSNTSTTSTTKVASSSTTSGSAASSTGSASPLPNPFDTSLGNNFTSQGCPDFITSFLNNATFKACLPFSLLLEVRSLSLPFSPPIPYSLFSISFPSQLQTLFNPQY